MSESYACGNNCSQKTIEDARARNRISKRKSRQRQKLRLTTMQSNTTETEAANSRSSTQNTRAEPLSENIDMIGSIPTTESRNHYERLIGFLHDETSSLDHVNDTGSVQQLYDITQNSLSTPIPNIVQASRSVRPANSISTIQYYQQPTNPSLGYSAIPNNSPTELTNSTGNNRGLVSSSTKSGDSFIGMNTLHILAERGFSEAIKYVINERLNIDEVDSRGYSALHLAVLNGHLSTVDTLLMAGADVEKRDPFGKTPLHIAAVYQHDEKLLQILMAHGADPSVRVLKSESSQVLL